jgi:RNA polymerase sigma-70 factor (ECF subfamily)
VSLGGYDAELLARCRRGDPSGWEDLVDRYAGYVYAIVGRGFRLSEPDCEDIFQETFARLFEHLDSIRDDSALRFWLAQTARRLAIDRLRRDGREAPALLDELPDPGHPDPEIERLNEALDLRAELDALPDRCREVIVRFFIRDESYRTISEAMDIPAGTIASRISRCLASLREHLTEDAD